MERKKIESATVSYQIIYLHSHFIKKKTNLSKKERKTKQNALMKRTTITITKMYKGTKYARAESISKFKQGM